MAIDDQPSVGRDSENMISGGAPHDGIVSVNDHGRPRAASLGPFAALAGVALVVLIGALLTVNVLRARLSGPKRPPAVSGAASAGLARDFGAEVAPPLPGDSQASGVAYAARRLCADGSAGNELRGQDGVVVRNASGQSVRVCPDGQVTGPPSEPVRPIPVARTAPAHATAEAAERGFYSAPRRPDGAMMLNDGHYGQTPFAPDIVDFPAAQGAVQPVTAAVPVRTEGLLTASAGTLEAELIPSKTPLVQAARLGDLNMLVPRGRTIDCGMSMRIVSSLAGQASCVVTNTVYSANGKVVLIERGSEAVGEYRSGVSIGQKRLFVLWNRIITPAGVVINLDSPGADALGSNGLTGKVDDHWFERIGSAFLLSTVQDAIQYEIAAQQARSGGATLVLGNTAQAGNQMAQKVLDAAINIPPTIYKNQGDRAVIYVARDLDFSNVYRLHAD